MNVKYSKPKIYNAKSDVSKIWYVWFYVYLPDGRRKMHKFRAGINKFKSFTQRTKEAAALRAAVEYRLKNGWADELIAAEGFRQEKDTTLIEHLKKIHEVKSVTLRQRSARSYAGHLDLFCEFLARTRRKNILPEDFSRSAAMEFMDFLMLKKYNATTCNHYLQTLRIYFNALEKREVIAKNYFRDIAFLPEQAAKNVAFSPAEKIRLEKYLYAQNRPLFYATRFIYYCFIRVTELSKLKVKDIDFKNHTITIPPEVSKNRKQESVTIPRAMEPILDEMGLRKADPQAFVFGYRFRTGLEPMKNPTNLTVSHNKIMRRLNIRKECTFYGWKHTGVVALYNAIKDPYIVMNQCRHADMNVTMRYMRSLGLTVNEVVRNADY